MFVTILRVVLIIAVVFFIVAAVISAYSKGRGGR